MTTRGGGKRLMRTLKRSARYRKRSGWQHQVVLAWPPRPGVAIWHPARRVGQED